MKKTAAVLLAVILFFSLFGCSVFNSASLLTLPKLSPEHAALAKYISEMTSGTSWSIVSPASGENRTAMQFVDLYGDGIPEAVVFYKNGIELSLRTCIYVKSGNMSYVEMCRIDSPGDGFVFVDYIDFNGDGSLELVVGTEYGSSSLNALKVYSLVNNTPALVVDTISTDYVVADMDGDGISDLLTAGVSESGEGMSVYMYRHSALSSVTLVDSAPLSYLLGTQHTVLTGKFNSNMRAVVFESSIIIEGLPYYVSDCITYTSRGGLESLSYSELYGYSYFTLRTAKVAVADVNLDGYLELPLPTYDTGQQTDAFINWYYYDSFGDLSLSCTTYTNLSEENWYLVCPNTWREMVYSVSKPLDAGLRSIDFITDYGSQTYTLLKLYVMSEDYSDTDELQSGWFFLAESGGYRFYGELGKNLSELPAGYLFSTQAKVRENFATIENGVPAFAGR